MLADYLDFMVCPSCLGNVRPHSAGANESLRCAGCGADWSVTHGIPRFTSSEARYSRDFLTLEQYREFFEAVARDGFDPAFDALVRRKDIIKPFKLATYLKDRRRNDFIYMLPLSPEATVLDFGSGWGNTSYTLAPHCKAVVAMEADPNRLRFSTEFHRSQGLRNILPVNAGTLETLPFKDQAFDVVIMNGVLEWTPLFRKGSPPEVHRKVLAEVLRVLKPGGAIFVSIENRYGYLYFTGKKDHHSGGLRWVPFLPRPLANLYSLAFKRRPYRTWFYSYAGLKELFGQAGYREVKRYTYFPNHTRYSHIFEIEDDSQISKVVSDLLTTERMTPQERRQYRLFRNPSLLKNFTQDFMVVARKP